MKPIYILNGPNLNMLGTREPDIYGHDTYQDLCAFCQEKAAALDLKVEIFQSNSEGQLVDWIQESNKKASGVILNAGAYTHTSLALHDALKAIAVPAVEVHLSNTFAREEVRHHSFLSPAVNGVICGFGLDSYRLALYALADMVKK